MSHRIAIFSTYAPSEGFGGPARIYHERRVLEAAGHLVSHVVLTADHAHVATRAHDFHRFVERPFRTPLDHIYHDVDLGARAAADDRLVASLRRHLQQHDIDVIVLEQPFLVDVVAAATHTLDIPVVYSCQNVEYRLRRDLERFQFDRNRPTDRSDAVRRLEERAVALARVVTTICETDRSTMLDEFGCDSVLVRNGSSVADHPLVESPGRPHDDPIDFAFAGSSYWPNVEGFGRIATPSLAFLPPGTKIHVAGSVSDQLLSYRPIARHHSANAARMVLRGFLPVADLVDMMYCARAVIVPVFTGEGSNLKSADALACGAPVIMTRRATHGYESIIADDSSGVTVVDDASAFRAAMASAVSSAHAGPVGLRRRAQLGWTDRLAPLVRLVESVG